MHDWLIASLAEHYQWQLSVYAALGIMGSSLVGRKLLMLSPVFREAARLNEEDFRHKMEQADYAAIQKWNRKWIPVCSLMIFGLALPFCLTSEAQPWWEMLLDVFVLLMFYDFFYYLAHRFLYHDAGFIRGPLIWMHAAHHRQRNPCQNDATYIHPLEMAIGFGLFPASALILSRFMGNFHLATIIVAWIIFSVINLQNHALWKADRFPFRYLKYMSVMHHHHHAKFSGGNFALVSLFYDWMFGTLDHGEGGAVDATNS